ncbi:hypothetical protein [Pseudacidobacterium ailaaui]|uniref:hypothetical protein n=1 Tax=Pseudacidobacterium ailaaui TaxID=1382359 RepID=UPI00047D7D4D|nr:hypothetical protein [Pseudacidobacterium ailaaui]
MNPILFENTAVHAGGAQPNPRLESAAHEFEAMLMKEMLKPLQEDGLFPDESSTEGSADTLMSYGAEAMAKGISEHGGLGIATQILKHFQESMKDMKDMDENSHRIENGQRL